jgi:hypothetical protein
VIVIGYNSLFLRAKAGINRIFPLSTKLCMNYFDDTLQENGIHLSVVLNSSVPTNIFKLYSSVLKPTNITLYLSVESRNRRI